MFSSLEDCSFGTKFKNPYTRYSNRRAKSLVTARSGEYPQLLITLRWLELSFSWKSYSPPVRRVFELNIIAINGVLRSKTKFQRNLSKSLRCHILFLHLLINSVYVLPVLFLCSIFRLVINLDISIKHLSE